MGNKYCVILPDGSIAFKGVACDLHENLEDRICDVLGFNPMLQESEDEGYLEMYIHTDTYEELSDEELDILDELCITEVDSLEAICNLLNIRIELYKEDYQLNNHS